MSLSRRSRRPAAFGRPASGTATAAVPVRPARFLVAAGLVVALACASPAPSGGERLPRPPLPEASPAPDAESRGRVTDSPPGAQIVDERRPGLIAVPLIPPTDDSVRAVRMVGHTVRPAHRPFSPERLGRLRAPAGFEVGVFAQDLENPRILAVREDGGVYVTERAAGRVTLLRDRNGDGRAEERRAVVEDLADVHGLAIRAEHLYMVTNTKLYRARMRDDGSLEPPELLLDDLPSAGQHPNRTMAFGPDGRLYLSIGSTCNACVEPDEESATLLRVEPDGSRRAIFARGLRNTIGFGWHPVTGELWGMDHNTDWRGDDVPPEELNLIRQARDYGWPFCWGQREIDPFIVAEPPDEVARPDYCARTEPAALEYVAHAAPMTMVFYTADQFPAEYRNDAFVAMRGSWNRNPPYGYKVVRITFDEQGRPTGFEDFVTGWLIEDGRAHFGRITGTAIAGDGALLVAEDENGVIYRVAHTARD